MLAQLPSNMLLTRLRPGIYLPCTTLVWSGVSIATAFTTNASSLFAVRFFLGVTEAPLFPGVSTTKWILLTKMLGASWLFSALVVTRFTTNQISQAIYLMSCWYTRKELALRISILYSGLLIAQAFSGIIAAGIFNGLEGTGGMLAWQWFVLLNLPSLHVLTLNAIQAIYFGGTYECGLWHCSILHSSRLSSFEDWEPEMDNEP